MRTAWAGLRHNAVWIAPAVLACGLVAGYAFGQLPGLVGDTIALVHGAHTISHCLSHAIFTNCDRQSTWSADGISTDVYHGIIEGDVGPYALFQYLPALVLEHVGFGDESVYDGLSVISLLAFGGVVALSAWVAAQTGRRWAPALAVLIITCSPLLFYAGVTFGESLAALLVVLVAVAALRRWHPAVIAVSALAACLTKETIFPIIALLGAAALVQTPVAVRALRRSHWYGLAGGVIAGVAISGLFNIFRYDQLTNFTYGHGYEQVPGLLRRLGLAVAVWVAPNAGLAIFWPLAGLLVIGLVVWTVRARGLRARLPGLALIAALLILTGTLASWYAPFGWLAWGPRLMLPVLPAVALTILVLYVERLDGVIRRLLGTWPRAGVSGLAVIALALPQVNVLHDGAAELQIFSPDRTCPSFAGPTDPGVYYRCLDDSAWGHRWVLLDTFPALKDAWGIVFAVGFLGGWVTLVAFMAGTVTPPAERRRVAPALEAVPTARSA